MNGAVDGESGGVHRKRIVGVELVSGKVDFYEAGCSDFIKQHAVRIDQKLVVHAGNFRRDMGENQIRPTIKSDQAITGRQIDSGLPFIGGNFFCTLAIVNVSM